MEKINLKVRKADHNQAGHGVLEMAIILPIVLFIGLSGLDLSRGLGIEQQLSMLSREGANVASRECTDLLPSCLQKIVDQTSNLLPGVQMFLSVYSYSAGGSPNQVATYSTSPSLRSKYDSARVGREISSLTNENPRIYICEVFYNYSSVTPYKFMPSSLYEATIF